MNDGFGKLDAFSHDITGTYFISYGRDGILCTQCSFVNVIIGICPSFTCNTNLSSYFGGRLCLTVQCSYKSSKI